MGNVAIDIGKKKSYIVIEEGGSIVREGYAETTAEGLREYLSDVNNPSFIVEASSTLDRVANYLEPYGGTITVAHPMKVRAIAQSMKKTDRNDAHTLLELNRLGYVPESYLPGSSTRKQRDLCRNRDFLVRQRTAVKNRIRDQAYRLCIDFDYFNRSTIEMLCGCSPVLKTLVEQLDSVNDRIHEMDAMIKTEAEKSAYAVLLDSIPGVGPYGALGIASEIGDVSRFLSEDNLFAYAGLVPRIHQSGGVEWKGHIAQGNKFMRYLLVECVQIHVAMRSDSPVAIAYNKISRRRGRKIARIAAARRLLRMMYYMLKKGMNYDDYQRYRKGG
jgi:transposase